MSLYTEYRPKLWKHVLGNEDIKQSVLTNLRERLNHAFLFHGPPGVGKTSIARLASKEVGDSRPLEIKGAVYTGVNDMREIISTLQYRPLTGETKAIIIDEAHRLSGNAWDSILAETEEPPEHVFWFFCTTVLGKIPKTIISRCSTYELHPVPPSEILELLDMVVEKEKFECHSSVPLICTKAANGSPRQALVNLAKCSKAKDPKQARRLLQEAEESSTVKQLAQALLARKPFMQVKNILNDMKEDNPESIRQEIRGYMTSVILNAKSEKVAGNAAEILDSFSEPFQYGDGLSPVVLAVCRVLLA